MTYGSRQHHWLTRIPPPPSQMPIERVRAEHTYDLTDMPASFGGGFGGGMVMEDEMVAYSAMPLMGSLGMATCVLALQLWDVGTFAYNSLLAWMCPAHTNVVCLD